MLEKIAGTGVAMSLIILLGPAEDWKAEYFPFQASVLGIESTWISKLAEIRSMDSIVSFYYSPQTYPDLWGCEGLKDAKISTCAAYRQRVQSFSKHQSTRDANGNAALSQNVPSLVQKFMSLRTTKAQADLSYAGGRLTGMGKLKSLSLDCSSGRSGFLLLAARRSALL